MSYQHLSLAERYYIEIERKMEVSINQIAKAIGRSQSTISREIRRNTGQRGYRHKQANRLAGERHINKLKAVKLTDEIQNRKAVKNGTRFQVGNRHNALFFFY